MAVVESQKLVGARYVAERAGVSVRTAQRLLREAGAAVVGNSYVLPAKEAEKLVATARK